MSPHIRCMEYVPVLIFLGFQWPQVGAEDGVNIVRDSTELLSTPVIGGLLRNSMGTGVAVRSLLKEWS